MLNGKKIIVVLPAYKAEKTLKDTVQGVPAGIVDEFILVDDCSPDDTIRVAEELGLTVFGHEENRGYGGNQKTCYHHALKNGADIVVMLHPDYQYDPRLVPAMAGMIASEVYDVVLGSRILGNGALRGGMPIYKYIFNRFLTFAQNILIDQKLSEYHTGYRAFSRQAIESIDISLNSDDFVFDNQMLLQLHGKNMRFGEISCPTKYFDNASSISFSRSMIYGIGVMLESVKFRLHKWGIIRFRRYV